MAGRRDIAEREVMMLNARWAHAEEAGDVGLLNTLLDDDFVAVGPTGSILDKSQWLARHESGMLRNHSFTVSDPTVRIVGNAAFVVESADQHATFGGDLACGRFRMTGIFERRRERWRLVALHLSAHAHHDVIKSRPRRPIPAARQRTPKAELQARSA